MKNEAFIFTIQILENSQTQVVFDYVEYIILLIFLMAASILMMLIPLVLSYSMIDNFIKMKDFKKDINQSGKKTGYSSKYMKTICIEYNKVSENFFKNFSALLTWNVFSFIYVLFGFENFNTGLKEYFYFPFAVLQSLSKEEIFESIYKFQSNWIFMTVIVLATFSLSFFGKYLGRDIANYKIKKMKLTF